jgi:hypothetical protein
VSQIDLLIGLSLKARIQPNPFCRRFTMMNADGEIHHGDAEARRAAKGVEKSWKGKNFT